MSRIIVIEDSPVQLAEICQMLNDEGFQTVEAYSIKSGKEAIEKASPMDIVLADMRLPDGQCFEILYWMRKMGMGQPFLVMSRYGDYSTVQTAINNGVAKFIDKRNIDEQLIPFIKEQVEKLSPLKFRYDEHVYERQGERFRKLREDMERYAMLGFRIMLTGEVGTGKHNLAKLYHALCGRTGEFVKLDCASLPEKQEAMALLFGREKDARHPSRYDGGLLEKAKCGTVMLENVDCLPDYAQKMLTSVLQNNAYKPVGALDEKRADVMFVATMNTMPDSENPLRLDFLHYLRNREVCIPALRDCPEDIVPLAEFFVRLFAKEKYLSAEAKSLLTGHQWAGNVHELKVAVQDAVSKSKENRILSADFELDWTKPVTMAETIGSMKVEDYMHIRIRHILSHATGLNEAVREFGKSKNTLYAWMDKLGIENPFKANKG